MGTILGGRAADYFNRKFGLGARLGPAIVCYFLSSIAVVAFGWGLALNSIFVPIVISFFIAFFRLMANPGCISYCIELDPRSPSAVMATISSFQIFVVCLFLFLSP